MAKAKRKPKTAPKRASAAPRPHRGKKASAQPFELDGVDCTMGKFVNGLEKHGDEDVPAFTLSIAGASLTKAQIDKFFGPYTSASWFNSDAATKLESPMDWWHRIPNSQIKVDDEFDVESLEIKCSGQLLKFESVDHKSDPDKSTPAGKVTDLVFKPQVGGITLLGFHLTVRPTPAQRNPLIDGQKGHIKITLGDMRAAGNRSKQAELALPPPDKSDEDGQDKRDEALASAGSGAKKPIDGTSAESRARAKASQETSTH